MSKSPNPLRLTVIDFESVTGATQEQAQQAARCIGRNARDAEDAALLLDIVLGVRRPRAPKPQPKDRFHSRTYRYPVPVGPEGKEYRAKVRAWGRTNGHAVLSRAPLEGWLLNAYVEATGDAWCKPEEAS